MGKWDGGFTVEDLKLILSVKLKEALEILEEPERLNLPVPLAVKKIRSKVVNLAVLLIQLHNACRISEASEGLIKWIETGKQKVYVRIRKRREDKIRMVVIPEKVLKVEKVIRDYFEDERDISPEVLARRVKVWSEINLNINTHSLRYAKITDLLERHNPITVAKITGHKRVDTLVEYAQEREAEEILEREVLEGS